MFKFLTRKKTMTSEEFLNFSKKSMATVKNQSAPEPDPLAHRKKYFAMRDLFQVSDEECIFSIYRLNSLFYPVRQKQYIVVSTRGDAKTIIDTLKEKLAHEADMCESNIREQKEQRKKKLKLFFGIIRI
jgi:hypothetical protein